MKLQRTHLMSFLTTLIGFIITIFMVGFLIAATLLMQQATDTIKTSIFQSGKYQQLLSTLAKEKVLQSEYVLHPSTQVRNEHLITATDISYQVQQDTFLNDASLREHIVAQQTGYLFYCGQFFAAIDARDVIRANAIYAQNIDPLSNQIEHELVEQTNLQTTKSAQALEQLTQIKQAIFIVGLLLPIMGLILVGVTLYVSKIYRRKLTETVQAEIAHHEQLISIDPLTGLGNHFAYQERLTLALQEGVQSDGDLVLALLDVDEFRLINEELGHQRGDEILCSLADLLREASICQELFRLSADKFALIVAQTSLTEGTVMLERLREDVHRRLSEVTVSMGISHTSAGELSREILQGQADVALAEAKRRGRNRVVAFASESGDATMTLLAKARIARQFLSEGKFTVAFQPIWNLASGTVQAFEALTRPDSSYGFAGPQELFDVVEQLGRAHELDILCVQAILARAAELPPNALLFVNLSPQTLVHDLLSAASLLEAVMAAGLEPSRVVLEVTERATVRLELLVAKVKLLQRLGFRIALDDAGAGNAGLEMLSQLPVDFVKIDRMIVSQALTDQAVRSVFVGIMTIANELDVRVIAEGIETTEMLDFIQHARLEYAQGYLLGRPNTTIPSQEMLEEMNPFASPMAI